MRSFLTDGLTIVWRSGMVSHDVRTMIPSMNKGWLWAKSDRGGADLYARHKASTLGDPPKPPLPRVDVYRTVLLVATRRVSSSLLVGFLHDSANVLFSLV